MTCPNCRTVNPGAARFCFNCGAALGASPAAEGERRLVTVLFADVVGSTSWAERVDPEEWTEIMNGALAFMIRAVTRFEGTVARLMGDGVLALFGAPVAHEDDAERAVLAALSMGDAAADYSTRLARFGQPFALRVGINTGLSVLTNVGDAAKSEYTAMGDSANLAARLQALAPPQGILIGPETHTLVRHAFETRARGPEAIRGKEHAVVTYEVLAPRPAGAAPRGLEGVESPFVGREPELARMREALSAAREGRPGLLLLVGEAGLGKSRLLAELREAEPDVAWLEGRAISYARTAPYHPWRQLLLASLGASETTPEAEVARLLSVAHPAPAGERPAWLAVLATLLGADTQEPDQEQPTLADARAAADEIVAAVHAHLSALAARRPLAVVLEDLHWADHASVRLLEGLAATLDDERVLLVAAMRPDRHTQAWQLLERAEAGDLDDAAPAVSVVRVKPLDAEGSATLFDELLRVEGMPAATRERILAKAEGNPFYLEEVLRSLIDSGHVVFEDGRWHARREITEVAIPDTLIGVLGARIDRLPEREREVAQTASVIGREFATRLLRAVMRPTSEEEAPDIEPQLGSLTVEGLLSQTRRARFADYRFKHEFTRDTAYERLLLKRRRELHARVAEELETLFGARREVAKDLAHHYLLGERWLEAARWSLQAARSAKRLYALPEALEAAETARAALDRLRGAPGSPGAPGRDAEKRLRAEVAAELVNLGLLARQHEDPALRPALLQRAAEAVELARELGDRRLLVTSLVDLGNVHVLSGFPGVGFEWLLQAHDLALELGDDRMFLYPFWVATEILLDDAPAAAVQQFGAVIELARKVGNKPIEAHALGTLTAALARLGDFAAAARTAGQALEAAEESGSIIKRADVNMLVGSAFLEMGRLEPGLELVQRGTDLALSVNGLECACNGLHLLGVGHLAERQLSAAEEDLKRSLATGEGTSMEALLHNVRATLASARFLEGELTAVEDIEREIANAEALRDGYGAAVARLALAEAHLSLAAPERAVPPARQALEWFRQRHMEPYVIRSLRLLAAAAAAQGDEAGRAALEREADELTQALPLPPDAGPLADAARGERRPPDGRASPGGSGG